MRRRLAAPTTTRSTTLAPRQAPESREVCRRASRENSTLGENLVAELGPDVVVNKLGCVLKRKSSGDTKSRLVADLRRSGGNGRLKIRERSGQPRVLDPARGVLGRQRAHQPRDQRFLRRLPHHRLKVGRAPPCASSRQTGSATSTCGYPSDWPANSGRCRLAAAAFRLTHARAVRDEHEPPCYVQPRHDGGRQVGLKPERSLSSVL